MPESSESVPPQVSSVVVESDPEPVVDINILLQSGVWGADIQSDGEETWLVYLFEGDTCYITWCGYSAMGGVIKHCRYTVKDKTVTVSWNAETEGPNLYDAGSETLLLSSDGTTLSGNDTLLQHRAFPTEGVDYFENSRNDWKNGQAEMGLRIRTAIISQCEKGR